MLKKPEKKKNEEGKAVQSVGSDISVYGEFDGSFRRMYTEDDKLFFFDEFCKHRNLTNDPQAAADKALMGGEGCAWNMITNSIQRESILPAPGGKKKERQAAADGEKTDKTTSSFVPDYLTLLLCLTHSSLEELVHVL